MQIKSKKSNLAGQSFRPMLPYLSKFIQSGYSFIRLIGASNFVDNMPKLFAYLQDSLLKKEAKSQINMLLNKILFKVLFDQVRLFGISYLILFSYLVFIFIHG